MKPQVERREDLAQRVLCEAWFGEVRAGTATPKQAADALDRAGVPFAVQCRLLSMPRATVRPLPQGTPAPDVRVEIPPCAGDGKDCSSTDGAPLEVVNHVPEPGTLALIGAGVAALAWRKS